ALDTASDDIALTLAKVYELTGRTAQARREVDRVLRRSPGELRALYQLVEIDPASRETYLGRIVERAPGNVAARLDLVEVLLARGRGGGGGAIAAAIRFSDVTTTAGLAYVPPLPDTASDAAPATGDYDGDGSEDVFVAGRVFHNELARATETTVRAGIRLRDRAVAAAFGDYDNDGRLDLFVATASGGRLFRNAGDSSFTDVTAAAGLGTAPPATTALFVDLDHDGDLDLFLATPAGNRVYRNVRNGQFQ